jgi:hypothetical protein
MKKSALILVCLFALSGSAQDTQKWVFGFGVNSIDNTLTFENQYFSLKNWNTLPFVSSFSVDRKLDNNFTVGTNLSMNVYEAKNLHNGTAISRDLTCLTLDVNAKYTFDQHLVDVKWLDASIVGGAGLGWLDGKNNQFFNTGFALDFWFSNAVGLRLQSLGKFAFDNEQLFNNHIRHSAEIVVKF